MKRLFISGVVPLSAALDEALRKALDEKLLKNGTYQEARDFEVKAGGCTFKGNAAVIGANGSCQVTILGATDASGIPLKAGAQPSATAKEAPKKAAKKK